MPDFTPEQLRGMAITFATRKVQALQQRMDAFMKRFGEYPADALEWSQDIFDGAAQLEAYRRVLAQLDKGIELEDIRKGHENQLRIRARNPQRSTSAASNLIEQSRHAAVAEILEMLEE